MITNKLMINDSKTEFIVFRSPQLKCDLSGLSPAFASISGLAKFDWKVVAQWATKDINLVAQQ